MFIDYTNIASGDFEQVILENITARAHFVVLLTPDSLDRCNEPGDWLRREIETAIDTKRNVIPLMLEGFEFSYPAISKRLIGKLELLKNYNGMHVFNEYFDEAMVHLREKFLNVPLSTVLHPLSDKAKKAASVEQNAADAAIDKIMSKNPNLKLFFIWILTNIVGGGVILVTGFILLLILISKCSGCVMPLSWLVIGFVQWGILRRQSSYSWLWVFISVLPMTVLAAIIGMVDETSGFQASLFDIITAIVVFGFQMGLTQWFFFRNLFSKVSWWPLSSALGWFVGVMVPFFILQLNKFLGRPWDVSDTTSVFFFVAVVGVFGAIIISSVLQLLILRGQSKRPYIWVGFNIAYWLLAVFISINLSNIISINVTFAQSAQES